MCWNLGGISRNVQHLGREASPETRVCQESYLSKYYSFSDGQKIRRGDSRKRLHHELMELSGRAYSNKRAKRWCISLTVEIQKH